jgi:hypothetical protein
MHGHRMDAGACTSKPTARRGRNTSAALDQESAVFLEQRNHCWADGGRRRSNREGKRICRHKDRVELHRRLVNRPCGSCGCHTGASGLGGTKEQGWGSGDRRGAIGHAARTGFFAAVAGFLFRLCQVHWMHMREGGAEECKEDPSEAAHVWGFDNCGSSSCNFLFPEDRI